MALTVDLELKKAFAELHQMMQETTSKLKIADLQIESLKRNKARAELTILDLKTMTPDTRTYESVGRAFLLTDRDQVFKNLSEKAASCEEKIKGLESNKSYLQRSMKESENNLREMVQQRKDKQDK